MLKYFETPRRVNNLNVEDNHTYFVSSEDLLVHNTSKCTGEMLKALNDAVEKITKAGVTADDLVKWSVLTEPDIIKLAGFIDEGMSISSYRLFLQRFTFGFKELENFGIKSLSQLDDFASKTIDFGDNTLEHVFKGELKSGSLSGYHYEGYPNAIADVKPGTVTTVNQYGVYQAEVT